MDHRVDVHLQAFLLERIGYFSLARQVARAVEGEVKPSLLLQFRNPLDAARVGDSDGNPICRLLRHWKGGNRIPSQREGVYSTGKTAFRFNTERHLIMRI